MYLARHETPAGPRWALDGQFLPPGFTLDLALQVPRASLDSFLRALPRFVGASKEPMHIRFGPAIAPPPLDPARAWSQAREVVRALRAAVESLSIR